jgi:CheY-like chemotaxis protein
MTRALKILVLDDERDAADVLAASLELYLPDGVVRVVYTGEDAVDAATKQRPDAVIFDLEMGGLGGEGAARALRSTFRDSRLLYIALSGNVLRLAALRNTGVFDYLLSKPVDVVALVELIRSRGTAA